MGKIILYYNDLVFSPSDSFLSRDFGQVPYVLSEMHGQDLEYWISASNPNPDFTRFRGRKVRQFGKRPRALSRRLDFLKNGRLYRDIRAAKGMTHLVVFPFTPITDVIVAGLAKRAGAKVIVKLDANGEFLTAMAADWARHGRGWRARTRQFYHYRKLLDMADLVICETSVCEAILRNGFMGLDLGNKLAKTFSGVSQAWLESLDVAEPAPDRRRNAIVVSGRLSIWIKHTELIFQAGPPPPGWTIEFVGEIDAEMERVIARYRAADPRFDDHYRFHGVITDKRSYYDILMHSRALLMNSRGPEGFPNVYADAQYCRLLIVTSDIASAADATDSGRQGIVYPRGDATALGAALAMIPDRIAQGEDHLVPEEYRRAFIWEHSLDQPVIGRLFDDAGAQDRTTRSFPKP